MRRIVIATSLSLMAGVSACASGPDVPMGPATVVRAAGLPAPPQGKFYADCIAASAAAGTYDRDAESDTLRFTCAGATAKVFYDGLAGWSALQDSEMVGEGRTWRFTQKLVRDPSGIDGCSTDGVGDYNCVVVLRIGEFLSN